MSMIMKWFSRSAWPSVAVSDIISAGTLLIIVLSTVLIALSSGSGTCYFLLLLSAILRASLCDDR